MAASGQQQPSVEVGDGEHPLASTDPPVISQQDVGTSPVPKPRSKSPAPKSPVPSPRSRLGAMSNVSPPEEQQTTGGGVVDGSPSSGDSRTDSFQMVKNETHTVMNGLKLKLQGHDRPAHCFTYATSPFMTNSVALDWKILTNEDVEAQNIRCHELKPGDQLHELLEQFQTVHTKAVVLINTQENYTIAPEFHEALSNSSLPVLVLLKSDGQTLLQLLDTYDSDGVYAKIDAENTVDAAPIQVESSVDTSISRKQKKRSGEGQKEHGQGLGQRVKKALFGSDKISVDLKSDLKKLMFTSEKTPVIISTDSGKFTMVMSAFSNYEKQAKATSSHSEIGEVFKRLRAHLVHSSSYDAPFYVLLAYRLHVNYAVYECDDFSDFVISCIEKVETMKPKTLAQAFNAFVDRGDFEIMFDAKEVPDTSRSVFYLLETASINLCDISRQAHSSMPSGKTHEFVYARMMWVTLALKLHEKRTVVTKSTKRFWQDHFTTPFAAHIPMTTPVINEIKKAIDAGRLLKLPSDLTFKCEHMADLLATERFIRPFHQIQDFFFHLESQFKFQDDVMRFLTNLRAHYDSCLKGSHPDKLKSVSKEGTLASAIQEGTEFLDAVYGVCIQRQFDLQLIKPEMWKWLLLLLQLVDVTGDNPVIHLKKFHAGKTKLLREFRSDCGKYIARTTRENFSHLSIQQFYSLYKAFLLFSMSDLQNFLGVYSVPSGVRINDATWKEFFALVVDRFGGAHNHIFLLELLQVLAAFYRDEKRAGEFVVDLLELGVPKLFAVVVDEKKDADEEVTLRFSLFLKDYISRNTLKQIILAQMEKVMASISEQRDEFQQLILNVIQREVIPEFKVLKDLDSDAAGNFRNVLQVAVSHLCEDLDWLQALSTKQKFCWGIVAACCSKIFVSVDNFEWVHSYDKVIAKLGRIYFTYCNAKKLPSQETIIKDKVPVDIQHNPCPDVKKYFEWVSQIHKFLSSWQKKFGTWDLNYDDILLYASNQTQLNSLSQTVCAGALVVDSQQVQDLKTRLLESFEQLNCIMLKYIPSHPEAKWCTLPALLKEYGVSLPSSVQDVISKHVAFPGDDEKTLAADLLTNPLPPNTTGGFQPGHDISLRLTKSVTIRMLTKLKQDIETFQLSLLDHLVTLVFFKLHHSVMFDTYLRAEIKRASELSLPAASPQDTLQFSGFPFSLPPASMFLSKVEKKDDDSLPKRILQKSLHQVELLLGKIMDGTATYSEIIANGELDLEKLDIEKEFGTLNNYITSLNLQSSRYKGLSGVRSLLELFKYVMHVRNILNVCEQYKLQGCLDDPKLEEVRTIVGDLKSEKDRSELTPNEAQAKMKRLKVLLCLSRNGKETSPKCLELFAVMADSAAFYQFVRDKQFHGQKGNAAFETQYNLITTQLQHEEYDETVLNHLRAAFTLIAPFMSSKQSFEELMCQVTRLDVTNGLKQLETVNANITLIRLWFSRSEGDTLQNVANELDCILKTGYYLFRFTHDTSGSSQAYIMLEYVPSTGPQFASSLEETDGGSGGPPPAPPPRPNVYPRVLTRVVSREDTLDSDLATVSNCEKWNTEQINDFVRKLGFLDTDKEKEGGEKIKLFLHISEIAYKLLELYIKLRELGHPKYISEVITGSSLKCNIQQEAANERVKETEAELTSWTSTVAHLRNSYSWLLFFSVPKVLKLHQLLTREESDGNLDQIVGEISFLCDNNVSTQSRIRRGVEQTLSECREVIESENSSMYVVGHFLDQLFIDHSLPRRSNESSVSRHRSFTSMSFSRDSSQLLHYCPGYSQEQLIRLIVGVYSGVPESFEVFHCRPTSTEEELSLFFKRATEYPLKYLVLQVNRLPFKLQECLMQLHLLTQQKSLKKQPQQSVDSEQSGVSAPPCIHFVETAPSVLREMPWVHLKEHKEPNTTFESAKKICQKKLVSGNTFACIQLVYGHPGDGKTHYIKNQLNNCDAKLTIAVNEAFTPLKAITKLRSLPLNKPNCGIFFNFTMLPPGESVDESERQRYHELMEVIGWFFFDLFLLGYVEDPDTGSSFRIPGGLKWAVYIEVPSRDEDMQPGEALKQFSHDVPSLGLLGTPHFINRMTPFAVDEDVQLVCKYLRALKNIKTKNGIDKLYREGQPIVKFSTDPNLEDEECQDLLQKYMGDHVKSSKITQKLFVKYMKRRCAFLDNLPAFNYNNGGGEYLTSDSGERRATDTKNLGSTLLKTMLSEVSDFCDPAIKENWALKPHQQLIYDFKDGGASFGLISLHPEKLPESDKASFKKIGVKIPSMLDLYKRDLLDEFLSRALNVELDENNHLTAVDDSAYVLTLDYMIKMLNIHERHECGVPVIIEGETGVGKTALVEMLSKLWNQSLLLEWKKLRGRLIDFFQRKLGEIPTDISETYEVCVKAVESMSAGEHVSEDSLLYLCQLRDGSRGQLYAQLKEYLLPMKDDPVVALLTLRESHYKHGVSIEQLFEKAQAEDSAETTANLLYGVLTAQVKGTFHKINVHAAMTPSEIWNEFQPVFLQAEILREAFEKSIRQKQTAATPLASVNRRKSLSSLMSVSSSSSVESMPETRNNVLRMPFVTVFLDEVNTSSCVGLFKEIIVDRTFDGTPIPENVFIVAACNPHRGNSLASHTSKDSWVRGSYYVRRLHPTLKFLMWDYGSLNEDQERDYINAKMTMLNHTMSRPDVLSLTDLIVKSQNLMRDYAYQQLVTKKSSVSSMQAARISSRSCVSQRDIQRVFTLYNWFSANYTKFKPHGERPDYHRRAVLVALGIVYYMRLNAKYRQLYEEELDKSKGLPGEVSFTRALQDELNWYISQVELPKGIARTQALKENLFATIVCTVTHTPLIIVGAPGSSKTLSFNQTIANLKGPESKKEHFRNTDIFRSLDPHYYQCSRRTTSNEIQTVFSRAINRQRSHNKFKLPIYCVVFMDEAGLPEESHESLKVLHYHLDKQEVSFVAITNHVLDAAKTNRAISLFRPEACNEDLETLAKGCLCSNPDDPPPQLKKDLEMVVKFCQPYSQLMEKSETFARFFGLRDFIHFVNYLRRKRDQDQVLTPQIVMQALERNFNGSEEFGDICKKFLKAIEITPDQVQPRTILEILQDSLQDRPTPNQDLTENEVRYKLIIDPSEDDSLVRLLFSFEVLQRQNTRMYVCSDFPGDGQMQKINTIAAIRHSAIEGHTVVMSQTDDIHESFYDLFNQRFRRIDDPEQGPRYYTTIAIGAHLKPSRVHPTFQCVVVLKKSEVKDTPAPFLNRFEKYLISHRSLLDTAFSHMPPCMAIVIKTAMEKVQEFIDLVSGGNSLYGFKAETLDSLVLTLLPPLGHEYAALGEPSLIDDSLNIKVYLLQELLQALRHSSGFNIPPVAIAELEHESEHLFDIILHDPEFDGLIDNLDHNGASQAVVESINMLHTAPPPDIDQQHALSPEGCMVISMLQQWLVLYFCKKLMQLMTSEALVLHRNKLPYTYLENYLANQPHFSLKDVVSNYYNTLEGTGWDRIRCPTNKVLCFTRSSQLIHLLPAQHPSPVITTQTNTEMQQNLEDYVFSDPNTLVVCKLSGVLSQSAVQDLFKKFIRSEKDRVCLLVANMQETSQQIVNHIRIMIEETESQIPHRQRKLFVFLLHFPPAQFFKPCYPSLFLKGWDHCYLDTIAHSAVKGGVDIRDWFCQCCFPNEDLQISGEDSLLRALKTILPQAIPILSSKVFFGTKENAPFNCPMNGSKRSEALQQLLFDKGVGNVLCEKFRAYWKPSVIAEYLEKAAKFSKNRESTLNITETIQSTFKSLFFDFLVCMIYRINENYNLDVLFSKDCTPAIQALFLDALRVFPTPKLSEVTLFSTNLVSPQPPLYVPRFPFFKLVCGALEKIVEQSHEEANVQLDILGEGGEASITSSIARSYRPHDWSAIMLNLQKAVNSRVEALMKAPKKEALVVALEAMTNHPELWDRYFGDFVLHKLRLESPEAGEGIAKDILYIYFGDLHKLESVMRIVGLHSYLHVYHLNLAKMAVILRPLNKIQKLHGEQKAKPHLLSPLPVSPSRQLISDIKSTRLPFDTPQYLASFVINTLFNALLGSVYQTEASMSSMTEKIILWFKAYRDVMTLPSLKKHVYHAIGPTQMNLVEARLNLMHATFLTLQSNGDLSEDVLIKGHKVFQSLLGRHFDEELELKVNCPRLADVTEVTVEILSTSSISPKLHQDNEKVRILMEGLFAHFFSAERQSYHPKDVRWFLELANEQQQWCAKDLDIESGVVAGGLNEDLVRKMEKSIHPRPEKTEVPRDTISINIFKMYLARVLGKCDLATDELSGPLLLYNHESRTHVCDVLLATPDLGTPKPYIPTFYQECPSIKLEEDSESALMQQPLAHLYFLTVLEHLMSNKDTSLPSFIRTANAIFDQCKTSTKHQVLLWIEVQAVIQVIIQRLALHLDPSTPHKIGDVYPVVTDVNWILDNDSMGGGKTEGHGMVLALHLLKMLKSSRKFTDLLVNKYETNLSSIKCLKPFNVALKQKEASDPKPHLLPFMLPGAESDGELAILYQRVKKAMLGIHKRTEKVDALVRIANECVQSVRTTRGLSPDSQSVTSLTGHTDKRLHFRMMVWLVTYYEFYDQNESSPFLCNVVGGQEISQYLKEEGYIRLIQCFLNPQLMLNRPEPANPLEGEQVLHITRDGRAAPIKRSGRQFDPLYKLFMPEDRQKQDQSDKDLRHSLANMVAIVIGSPPRSNHLWYHLFASEQLPDTYLTGFMYNAKINPDGLLYDCGVELSPDGQFGRQDYQAHAGRGTYTLHSLYLLLWANFGSFCMALLTQPDSDIKIHGPLISEWLSIRHYCVSQLRAIWLHLRNNLNLSEEERSFFITRSMKRFYEVLSNGTVDSLRGIFKTREELDSYEKMWHCLVYQPSWDELKVKFAQYSQLWQNKLFVELRRLNLKYPHFPTDQDFTHRVLACGNLEQHSQGGELRLLSQFSLDWSKLQAGGLLLPDLVEFYQWLHTQLAYLVTYEKATTWNIGQVIQLVTRRYSKEMGAYLKALYERVKIGYNKYVELIGGAIGAGACAAVKQGNKVYTIADEIPLLHFLTDVEQEEQGNDWLYAVIANIVAAHNMAIETVYSMVESQRLAPLRRLLPDEPSRIYVTEMDQFNCIVGNFSSLHGVTSFLQMIRSRYQPSLDVTPTGSFRRAHEMSISGSLLQNKPSPSFQLKQLEEDMVATFIAGKPIIHSPDVLRSIFKFRQTKKSSDTAPADVVRSALDLDDVAVKLTDEFKAPLEESLQKRMEYEFHSAGYHALIEVVTGLRTVAGHLIKVLVESRDRRSGLESLTVSKFLLTIYDHLSDSDKVLEEINIQTLNHSQLTCISDLPLSSLYKCLELFFSWVDEGLYDFSSLPFPVKTHLSSKDREKVENLRNEWTGSLNDLLSELKQMIEVLKHSEADIMKNINVSSQKPIIVYLKEYHMLGEGDQLPKYIPKTILLHHYVSFRLALRRALLRLQAECASESTGEGGEAVTLYWSEVVNDLWQQRLPHLRDVVVGDGAFVFDPTTGHYGFQEDAEYAGSEVGLMEELEKDPEDFEYVGEGNQSMPTGGSPEPEESEILDSFAKDSELESEPQVQASHTYDLENYSSDEERELSSRVEEHLESKLKKDPSFQKKVLSMIKSESEILEQNARKYTTQKVGKFLASINLTQYVKVFEERGIDGEVLLEMETEGLEELEVTNAFDKLKILVLFRRKLRGGKAKHPVSEVVKCLRENNLDKYCDVFEKNHIDGDMLLYKDGTLVKHMLKEVGVTSQIDTPKIISKFKTAVTQSSKEE